MTYVGYMTKQYYLPKIRLEQRVYEDGFTSYYIVNAVSIWDEIEITKEEFEALLPLTKKEN